jgi:plasmid maintenance system killer protein
VTPQTRKVMNAPPGNNLKEYDRAWHVRINDQWRLTFMWVQAAPMTGLGRQRQ